MIVPTRVNMASAVSRCAVALATPKSIILGAGAPSISPTRMLEGFRSRCRMAFWRACRTPSHRRTNNSSLWRIVSLCLSQ
jgi:hypothetical protein